MNKKEVLEAILVRRRQLQLEEKPICGNFDVAHLKETHRYL